MPHILELDLEDGFDVEISCNEDCQIEYWHKSDINNHSAGISGYETETQKAKTETMPISISIPHGGHWFFKVHSEIADEPKLVPVRKS